MSLSMKKKEALLSFITEYQKLPALWDVQNPSYYNRVKKQTAYDILIEKLKPLDPDATRERVVMKINNLRSSFRKELKKVNDSKRLGDDVYVPRLWYFNDLMFLVDQEPPDTSESTVESGNENNEDTIPSHSEEVNQLASTNKKRKTTTTTESNSNEDDEFLTLAKGYAVKLKKLTPQQYLFADKMINDVLFDAQMGLLSRESHLVNS